MSVGCGGSPIYLFFCLTSVLEIASLEAENIFLEEKRKNNPVGISHLEIANRHLPSDIQNQNLSIFFSYKLYRRGDIAD